MLKLVVWNDTVIHIHSGLTLKWLKLCSYGQMTLLVALIMSDSNTTKITEIVTFTSYEKNLPSVKTMSSC